MKSKPRLTLLIILIPLAILACRQKENQKPANNQVTDTTFEVKEEIHNFGTLVAGENVVFTFELVNTGKADLIIKKAESDCGCISLAYKSEPVKPGKTAIIEVSFNTSGLFGRQYKPIAIESNTIEKIKYLAVVADVKNDLLEINN